MPKVKMLQGMAGLHYSYAAGDLVEVSDEISAAWAGAGIAEPADDAKGDALDHAAGEGVQSETPKTAADLDRERAEAVAKMQADAEAAAKGAAGDAIDEPADVVNAKGKGKGKGAK